MAVILVPKPPKDAFDPTRPPSTLLRSQIDHLEWAARAKVGESAMPRRPRRSRTEARRTQAYVCEEAAAASAAIQERGGEDARPETFRSATAPPVEEEHP